LRRRAVQQHAIIHPAPEDDSDISRHIFPEIDADDSVLTDLDKVFGSSLFDAVHTGVDLRRSFEMHMLGAGIGLFPAAAVSSYMSIGSGGYSTAVDELIAQPEAGLLMGWAAVSLILHPLVVTQLVVRRSMLSYPFCEMAACVGGVLAGSYFAEDKCRTQSCDGVQPITVLQGAALVVLAAMLTFRANGALASLERDYAEASLRSLKERLPKLSSVPVLALCTTDDATSERLYAQAFNWMDAAYPNASPREEEGEASNPLLRAEDEASKQMIVEQLLPLDQLLEEEELDAAYYDDDHNFSSTSDTMASLASRASGSSGLTNQELELNSRYQRLVHNDQAILGPNTLSTSPVFGKNEQKKKFK